jgi:membrane protein implicated in regulation of membrane protease activity
MKKGISIRLMVSVILSIADEAILIAIGIIILLLIGVEVPVWAVVTLALIFLINNFIGYWALRNKPQMGFENKIGQTGLVVESVARKGTIRIGRELWWAITKGASIEVGSEVQVIDQVGLKLTVVKKQSQNDIAAGI